MATKKKTKPSNPTLELLQKMVNETPNHDFSRITTVDGIKTFIVSVNHDEMIGSPIHVAMTGSYLEGTLSNPDIGLYFDVNAALSLAAALIDAAKASR